MAWTFVNCQWKTSGGKDNLHQSRELDQVIPYGVAEINNLGKLVLDALNGVVYTDDRQVVELTLHKLLDNKMDCLGCTIIKVFKF
jgi:Holliday junction resolvase RusA-like endonuclease